MGKPALLVKLDGKYKTLGSLITATLLGIGDYVGLHVVFRRTKLSVFLSIIPPQLLGFYKVANTVLLSISEPRVRRLRFGSPRRLLRSRRQGYRGSTSTSF